MLSVMCFIVAVGGVLSVPREAKSSPSQAYRRLRRGGVAWWGEQEIAAKGRQGVAGRMLTFSNFSMVRLSIPPHL
jgi:hypothetical protein